MSSSLDNSLLLEEEKSRVVREAHNGRAIDYAISNFTGEINPEKFIKKCEPEVSRLIRETEKPLKTQIKLHCEFQLINRESGQIEKEEKRFISSFQETVNENTDLDEILEEMRDDLLEKLFNFMSEKSGWSLKSILDLHVNISKYIPLSGSTYTELPSYYKSKRCVVNILNKDNACGKWAILAALHSTGKHDGRVTKKLREYEKLYNWEGVNFPLTVGGIETFEKKIGMLGL